MLLSKPQATAVADCLTAVAHARGLIVVEFAKPWRVKVVEMFDGSIIVSQASGALHETHADALAFRDAYGVA